LGGQDLRPRKAEAAPFAFKIVQRASLARRFDAWTEFPARCRRRKAFMLPESFETDDGRAAVQFVGNLS